MPAQPPSAHAVVSPRGAGRWQRGHPWIFRSDVLERPTSPAGAVQVRDERWCWAAIAVALFAIDLEHHLLPDRLTLPGIAVGLILSIIVPPGIVETAAGADRAAFTFLIDAYREEEVKGEKRVSLALHPQLAPYKVAVLPLLKKRPEIVELCHRIKDDLKRDIMAVYDVGSDGTVLYQGNRVFLGVAFSGDGKLLDAVEKEKGLLVFLFAIISLVRDSEGEATHLSRWAGIGRKSPLLAGVFTFILLAFAGIPLTSGFTSKFAVFGAAAPLGLLAPALRIRSELIESMSAPMTMRTTLTRSRKLTNPPSLS